jgi:alkanesulfonate monooxygenase SsuD/methylene tetrahydromethanopterin reductase-like flavin-dependent oxidoreductase (luciferase family)
MGGPREYADLDAEDLILFGDPPTVRAKLRRLQDTLGLDGFTGIFAFGQLSHERVCRSLRLFAEEVMPAFRATPTAAPV